MKHNSFCLLFVIEVSSRKDIRHGNLIRLPCAHFYLRSIMIGHVNQQEEIAFVCITSRSVFLSYLDTIYLFIFVFIQPLHIVVRKTNVDKFVVVECTFYVLDIGVLVVAVIFYNVTSFR